jgi:hypothetical protein
MKCDLEDVAKGTLAGGVDCEAARRATFNEWLRTFVHGATPEQLRTEIEKLQSRYNDDDLRRVISALQKSLPPRPRKRRITGRKAWDTAEGIQTKQEIKLGHEIRGLRAYPAHVYM